MASTLYKVNLASDQALMTPCRRAPERNIIGLGCDLALVRIAVTVQTLRITGTLLGQLDEHVFLDIFLNTFLGEKNQLNLMTAFLPLLLTLSLCKNGNISKILS